MGNLNLSWVVIYDDLSTFSSEEGSFADAPAWGIQAIAYESIETGWSVCTGGDYFHRLPSGEFIAIDKDGLVDRSANIWKTIKVGRQVSREEFNKVMGIAQKIMGEKTAHFKNERRS